MGLQNFEYYKVFYTTASEGSLSAAADRLFLSQPAVSRSIKTLEENLGTTLFIRYSRGVALTEAGKELFQYVEQSYNLIQKGERRLQEMQSLKHGEVRIGASDTLCRYYLLPFIESFHQQYPGIHLKVTNRTSAETVSLLKSGHVDFGLINLPFDDQDLEIVSGPVIQDCLIGGRKFEYLSQIPLAWKDLSRIPLLMLEGESRTRAYLEQEMKRHGVLITPEVELGSIDLLVEFARIGLGVAFVIKDVLKDLGQSKELFEIRLEEDIAPRAAGIAWLKQVPLSPGAKVFVDLMIRDTLCGKDKT